jgi:hypothetical protein
MKPIHQRAGADHDRNPCHDYGTLEEDTAEKFVNY